MLTRLAQLQDVDCMLEQYLILCRPHTRTAPITLCSHWDKKYIPVLLLSSMHGQQTNQATVKPDIVHFYGTKAGVDNLKLNCSYSTKRKCRCWLCSIFFALLDNACYAAFVLWNDRENVSKAHYVFKRDLAYELCMPHIKHRKTLPKFHQTIRGVGIQFSDPHPT